MLTVTFDFYPSDTEDDRCVTFGFLENARGSWGHPQPVTLVSTDHLGKRERTFCDIQFSGIMGLWDLDLGSRRQVTAEAQVLCSS